MSQTCSFGRPPITSRTIHQPAAFASCRPRPCAHADRQCTLAQLGRSAFTQSSASLHSTRRRASVSRGLTTRTHALLSVKEATFESEVLKADKTVLVDFWAPWCGPCRLIEPLLTQIEQETPDLKIVKTDADSCPQLVEKYKVYGLPTLMLFKDGKKVDASHREGAITKPKLLQYLEQHGVVPAPVSS